MEIQRVQNPCPPEEAAEGEPRAPGALPTPAPAPVPIPPGTPPDLAPLIRALLDALGRIPGVEKQDGYLYDDRGITAANPTLNIDVASRLRRPAVSGFIISDTATIKVDINSKGQPVALNATDKISISPLDPLAVSKLSITSASTTAGVRIFLV